MANVSRNGGSSKTGGGTKKLSLSDILSNVGVSVGDTGDISQAISTAIGNVVSAAISNVNAKNGEYTWDFIDPKTGETRKVTIGGDNYKYDNFANGASKEDVYYAIQYMLTYGNNVNADKLQKYLKEKTGTKRVMGTVQKIIQDARTFFDEQDIDLGTLGKSEYYKPKDPNDPNIQTSANQTVTELGETNSRANEKGPVTFDIVHPETGEIVQVTIGGDDYEYDNFLRGSGGSDVYYALEYMITHGDITTKEGKKELLTYIKSHSNSNVNMSQINSIVRDVYTTLSQLNIDKDKLGKFDTYNSSDSTIAGAVTDKNEFDAKPEEEKDQILVEQEKKEKEEAKDLAYNEYWNNLYDLENEDTLGSDMLRRLTEAEQNAAMSNMQLAEAQYQQAAMDQAAVVKSITDQVKAERMAKLKAGMNEAQIANQDMQIMLNNMNTLNQQVNNLNQNRLAAQQQYNLAQDTAYQQYLNTATNMGSTVAAMTTSDAGNPYQLALKYSKATGVPISEAYSIVTTGGKTNGSNN